MQILSSVRTRALEFEKGLQLEDRKVLGQFFTGLPLSRILAALCVREETTSVIDPMAGNGDLLDAVFENLDASKRAPGRLDAIEIDSAVAAQCKARLKPWIEWTDAAVTVHRGSAFDPVLIGRLPSEGYDLVITNPPYVRYQTQSRNVTPSRAPDDLRRSLLTIVEDRVPKQERVVWRELVRGYSGLSDLSVPSWILAAMLVKPGGVLGVVAPATWRSRNYADVLQYLLARFFELEAIVADRQPGWFSQALVRTHLVVARRLSTEQAIKPLGERARSRRKMKWVEIDPTAKAAGSLVGSAFPSGESEQAFAQWLLGRGMGSQRRVGISVHSRPVGDEIGLIAGLAGGRRWAKRLEPSFDRTSLFGNGASHFLPEPLASLVPSTGDNFVSLAEAGIAVSQGLRTGCNRFFYVDSVGREGTRQARVRLSPLFGSRELVVPSDALRPVLRRQSELKILRSGEIPPGRVLDLSSYVLPEDATEVERSSGAYKSAGESEPKIMPDELASYVREAGTTAIGDGALIPELSAVRTNTRSAKADAASPPPRYWYMLPPFKRRHLPDVFVPRVNQRVPEVDKNLDPPVLIDANFSTLWVAGGLYTPAAILALLSSAWVSACMEQLGTPMGGGALKLEATHLRRLMIPRLTEEDIRRLDQIGSDGEIRVHIDEVDAIVVTGILQESVAQKDITKAIRRLRDASTEAMELRQRRKSP